MSKVFIVAPANTTTGGPEVIHQLADAVNQGGKRAFLVYYPFEQEHEVPEPYRQYDVHVARREDVEPGSDVVLPEIYCDLVGSFPEARLHYWWLSVSNFFHFAGDRAGERLEAMRGHVDGHLYQSDYARKFLELSRLEPAHRLSDRLSDGYLEAIANPPGWDRQDVVAYNPTKGIERTIQVLRALDRGMGDMPKLLAIRGMDTARVQQVLGRAKVYMDFGGHPGKDRLPREAAAMGCCVLTNRRGSANNPVDMPIPPEFKVNDHRPGWERRAASALRTLVYDFDRQQPRFDAYRAMIAAEPAGFLADVQEVFSPEGNVP
jgi:hypothetical protein